MRRCQRTFRPDILVVVGDGRGDAISLLHWSKVKVTLSFKYVVRKASTLTLSKSRISLMLTMFCRLSKDSRWILYRVLEYDPLLDSSNMTYDDYVQLATDISVSLVELQ